MGKKKSRSTPATNCVCSSCGTKAHAIPDSIHRRCSGNPSNAESMPKGKVIEKKNRGTWQKG